MTSYSRNRKMQTDIGVFQLDDDKVGQDNILAHIDPGGHTADEASQRVGFNGVSSLSLRAARTLRQTIGERCFFH